MGRISCGDEVLVVAMARAGMALAGTSRGDVVVVLLRPLFLFQEPREAGWL